MRRAACGPLAAVAALVIVGGCSGTGSRAPAAPFEGSSSPVATAPPTVLNVGVGVSWAETYASAREAFPHADLVVVGTILDHASEVDELSPPDKRSALPFTTFRMHVERVLRGTASNVISILQTGGSINGAVFQVSDDPLMHDGDRDLLFLRRVGAGDPHSGMYFVIGGPTGRYEIAADGTVTSPGVQLLAGTTLGSILATLPSK